MSILSTIGGAASGATMGFFGSVVGLVLALFIRHQMFFVPPGFKPKLPNFNKKSGTPGSNAHNRALIFANAALLILSVVGNSVWMGAADGRVSGFQTFWSTFGMTIVVNGVLMMFYRD